MDMNKNYNTDTLDAIFEDAAIEMTFRDLKAGMDRFFEMMNATTRLTNLIRTESELKKHHRAYLHIREEINGLVETISDMISETITELNNKEHIYRVRNAYSESDAPKQNCDSITIPTEKYDVMVDDLLTMAEMIDLLTELRTQDIRFMEEMSKCIPAFAECQKERMDLFREAAAEAEDIYDRWADELGMDEDYEPDEYFSD